MRRLKQGLAIYCFLLCKNKILFCRINDLLAEATKLFAIEYSKVSKSYMSSTSSIYYIDYFNILGVHSSCDQNCEGGAHTQGRYVGSSEIEVCPSFGNERKDWHSSEGLILKLSFYFSTSFIKKIIFIREETFRKAPGKADFL